MSDVFEGIIGQESALRILRTALTADRLAGAYLFVGPEGSGKTTTALRLAAALCGAPDIQDIQARLILDHKHPDVRLERPSGRSHTIHVGQLWPRGANPDHPASNAMLRDLQYEPVRGKKRVFIIREAEGLSRGGDNAANSILKTLEEPPPYAHFILTAASVSGILPTILSRCQLIHFNALSRDEVVGILTERFAVASGTAGFLAAYTGGRLGQALRLARSQDVLAAREEVLDIAERLLVCPPVESFKLSERFRKVAGRMRSSELDGEAELGGREPLKRAMELLGTFYRDIMAARSGCGDHLLINADRINAVRSHADRAPSTAALRDCVERIAGAGFAIDRNGYAQTVIDVLFLQLTSKAPASR